MTLRAARRAVALSFGLLLAVGLFWLRRLRGPMTLVDRARWLQQACKLILKCVGIHYEVEGTPPQRGVLVANHLTYMDVLVISAATPCFFVAKMEIDSWPFFGMTARMGGTLFLDRSSLASAEAVSAMIAERLALPVPVLFFPEGTSTDGTEVWRFHSRLFEPPVAAGAQITAAAIEYVAHDGRPERDLCWYGDDAFVPHLGRTLDVPGISARVSFGEPRVYGHRREAADATHDEIESKRKGVLVAQ